MNLLKSANSQDLQIVALLPALLRFGVAESKSATAQGVRRFSPRKGRSAPRAAAVSATHTEQERCEEIRKICEKDKTGRWP